MVSPSAGTSARCSASDERTNVGNAPNIAAVGKVVVDPQRRCPMCGHTTWVLLDGHSLLQALEGGLEALAYSCDACGFIRWHRMDKAEQPS
jgi:hypothetical protein